MLLIQSPGMRHRHAFGKGEMGAKSLLNDPMTGHPFQKVVIFRALQLGDLLCAVPALRSLRQAVPRAEITLVGLAWAREFAHLYNRYIDEFVEFPGFPGLPERTPDLAAFSGFCQKMQARRFDLAIQLHGSGRLSNSVVSLFGARFVSGFFVPGHFCPDPDRFLPHVPVVHEVWRNLMLMEFLGAEIKGEELDFFGSNEGEKGLRAIEGLEESLRSPLVIVHPGARERFRCWDPEKFAHVADHLSDSGCSVAVTGSHGEKDLVEAVIRSMRNAALNLCGKTDLATLGALFRRSNLLLCNDTGVSHLAVATGLKSVVVFTRSEFLGWPPLDRVRHRVVSRLGGPGTEDVLKACQDLLHAELMKASGVCAV